MKRCNFKIQTKDGMEEVCGLNYAGIPCPSCRRQIAREFRAALWDVKECPHCGVLLVPVLDEYTDKRTVFHFDAPTSERGDRKSIDREIIPLFGPKDDSEIPF